MAKANFFIVTFLSILSYSSAYNCDGKGMEPFYRAAASLVGLEYPELSSRSGM